MPLVRIALRRGKAAAYLAAITDGIYQAMREVFDVPEDDRFMLIDEHDETSFSYSGTYLGIARTDELVIIQITCNNTRTVQKKAALYQRIAGILSQNPGLRPEDIFINLVEVPPENWSFGNGMAQYAKPF